MPFVIRLLCLLIGLSLAGCASRPSVADLQAVYGPPGVEFERQSLFVDLNDDGIDELLILLVDQRRGILLPLDSNALASGFTGDGFAVYDGRHPSVPVFYQYNGHNGGYDLRLDQIDNQLCLVSDGGRDHVQKVWGWWRYKGDWLIDGWEARKRSLQADLQTYGAWSRQPLVSVIVGK